MRRLEDLVAIAVVIVLLFFFIFRIVDRIPILRVVLYFVSIIGGMLGDFEEIETVGSVMCLSCMGLQQ
jgi:hypothetical protein